jgi:hypothetical protein
MDEKRQRNANPLVSVELQREEHAMSGSTIPSLGTDISVTLAGTGSFQLLELPPERVPISVDHYGNTSAACTLVLLDEDRRAGRVKEGDLVAFLWIGAGNGAMNGCVTMVL